MNTKYKFTIKPNVLETRVAHAKAHRIHINVVVLGCLAGLVTFEALVNEWRRSFLIFEHGHIDLDLALSPLSYVSRQSQETRMAVDGGLGEKIRVGEWRINQRISDGLSRALKL